MLPLNNQPVNGLRCCEDGKLRCFWAGDHADYARYHDTEWGVPNADDRVLFEKICLEGFQSGLSWLTILRKRENFREAFDRFDFKLISQYNDQDIKRLLNNSGIVRHRGKIMSTINNARRACEMEKEFGSLARFFWQREPAESARPKKIDYPTLLTLSKTLESTVLSRELKKRGWSFVGPTTAYAFMQALGMVNDHIEGCCMQQRSEFLRGQFQRP